MTGNDFMAWILRSPLHGLLSKNMMVITLTGRKTGRKISTPVGFYRDGNLLWIITTRGRTWWRNVRSAAPVTLRLQGQDVAATAEAILDDDAVRRQLMDYLQRLPDNAKYIHIRKEGGAYNTEDIELAVKERLFVKVTLPQTRS